MATSNETATYIGDLPTSPTIPIDSLAGGRSRVGAELRKTKAIMKATFPNVDGAVTATDTELEQLAGVSVGGTSAGDIATIDGTQTLSNKTMASATVGTTQSASDNSTKLATTAYADAAATEAASLSVPAGAVVPYAMATAPAGWLECNGAAVSRTTYATLFTAVSTVFGIGDGSTTFNVPDLRGQFVRGWDHTAGTDPDAASRTDSGDGSTTGDNVGTQQADELASHAHSIQLYNLAASTSSNIKAGYSSNTGTGNTNGTGGNETRPININLMYCIKT